MNALLSRQIALLAATFLFFSIGTSTRAAAQAKADIKQSVAKADQLFDAHDYPAALDLYRQAATAGNAHAMTRMGYCYDMGYSVKEDSAQALLWYHKAADAGDLEAMAFIGGMYAAGTGVPADPKQALVWFHKAADAGNPAGMNKLGLAYMNGQGVQQDPKEALRWFTKAADLGDMYAAFNLSNMYTGKSGIPKDGPAVARWMRKSADLGNPAAMVNLANMYQEGLFGLPRDAEQARYWYTKSAALGNEIAKTRLAYFHWTNYDFNGDWEGYYTFQGLPEAIHITQKGNSIQAIRVRDTLEPTGIPFLRATYDPKTHTDNAEVADPNNLGLISLLQSYLQTKQTGEFSYPTHWTPTFLMVLDPDHLIVGEHLPFQRISAPGRNDVPCSYDNPLGVKITWAYIRGKMAVDAKNYDAAGCWFHLGVMAGDARSRSAIGDMVRNGTGTQTNPANALIWYSRAAQGGDIHAAKSIAEMYDSGELPANPAQSQQWHAKAQAMQARYDKFVADEKKKAAKDQAEIRFLGGLTYIGAQMLSNEMLSSPQCDTSATTVGGNRIPNTTDPKRVADKERLLASGEIYCGSPIDISPLLPDGN
jgi:TPR repeat protein